MKVLALDCCFGAVSSAVRWCDPNGSPMLHQAYEERATGHAEHLMPMIDRVMDESRRAGGPDFQDLDRLAVTTGPGSFTGVRTGIAAARALALAAGLPVCSVSSLELMAHVATARLGTALQGASLAIAIDARRDEIYLQCFTGQMHPRTEAMLVAPAEACHLLATGAWIVAGSGAQLLAVAAHDHPKLALTPMLERLEPCAAVLAGLAMRLPVVDTVKPLYLRPPDAKPQMSKILPRA